MRATLALAGLLAVASALSPTLLVLGLTRGLAGGLFGAAYPAALIYIGDTVPAAVRQRDIARLMVGVALGTALASIGAGIVAGVLSWRLAFVVTGGAAVLTAWRLRVLAEPEREHPVGSFVSTLASVGRSRVTLFVLACACAEGAVLLGTITLLPPAIEHAGATTAVAGVATGVYGVSVFASSRLVGWLTQHWPPAGLIGLGAGSAVASCSLLALHQSVAAATVAAALLGLAWTSMHSTLQTWGTEVLAKERATVVSLFAGSLFVGSSRAAVVASGLADAGRYGLIFAVSAVLAVPLGVSAALVRSRWHRPAPVAS
jgi:predicted MFS family arabinose efflux permease